MTSVPLLCNICPKQPDFSDISHLLTHVASKGHLSQQFKAQVRARQDVAIREKLDAYDRWFELHQIERLLSERMIAKDTKDSSSRGPTERSNLLHPDDTKLSKPGRRRMKAQERREQTPIQIKVEGNIDPQLSIPHASATSHVVRPSSFSAEPHGQPSRNPASSYHGQLTTPPSSRAPPHSALSYHHHSHRAYVPLMSQWQSLSPPHHASAMRTLSSVEDVRSIPQSYDSDPDNECFKSFLRSPSRTTYPDPAEVGGFHSGYHTRSNSPTTGLGKNNIDDHDEDQSIYYGTEPCTNNSGGSEPAPQSPILKGIKWPGMSLFDSASLEAQRLRNQKKDTSVLEHMQNNSALVEQIERIYWPDGSLKKERTITGNVESSPVKEPTPPPKPQRRRRAKADTSALTQLSTNTSNLGRKPRTRKPAGKVPTTEALSLVNESQRVFGSAQTPKSKRTRNSYMGYDQLVDACSSGPMANQSLKGHRKRGFEVYKDTEENARPLQPPLRDTLSHAHGSHINRGSRSVFSPDSVSKKPSKASANPLARNPTCTPSHIYRSRSSYSRGPAPLYTVNDENVPQVQDTGGSVDDIGQSIIDDRVTQRYFMMASNEPPRFFSSMPPGWDFGGPHQPRYHGSTLNPLNASVRQHNSRPHPSQIPFSHNHNTISPFDVCRTGGKPKP